VKYFDITPRLSSKIAVFPGDRGFSRSVSLSFKKGDHLDLSSIQSTLHVGAHVDAPSHYHASGKNITECGIDVYLGRAQVIEIRKEKGERIRVADLKNIRIEAPRLLFKTQSFPDPHQWTDDFNALSRELILELAQKGVRLVGIDTPSVDLAQDAELESHKAIYEMDLRILEGIDLKNVAAGLYTLIALPLPIEDADASPVRAILINKDLGIP
jgi:arylformamidase